MKFKKKATSNSYIIDKTICNDSERKHTLGVIWNTIITIC